jgi:NAD(P)H dehydrogenase (quinone)
MYAIMGITGRVGGAVAATLLAQRNRIRAIVRSSSKGSSWAERGAELAVADSLDTRALARAFRDVAGVFVMTPPDFAPSPGFPESRAIVGAIRSALADATPPKIVCLSSIGAQHDNGIGLLHKLYVLERQLGQLSMPCTFLRPGWFMENAAWDVEPARQRGEFESFLQPVERPVPMVATADVGRVAAELLLEEWTGRRIVELEGPERVSPKDVAGALGRALGRDVVAKPVAHERWASIFESQGTSWPEPRVEMLDAFNSGWADFEGRELRHGRIRFDDVAAELVGGKGGES